MGPQANSGYVFNGLNMYYEDHGVGGVPLVLLHGGLNTKNFVREGPAIIREDASSGRPRAAGQRAYG